MANGRDDILLKRFFLKLNLRKCPTGRIKRRHSERVVGHFDLISECNLSSNGGTQQKQNLIRVMCCSKQ